MPYVARLRSLTNFHLDTDLSTCSHFSRPGPLRKATVRMSTGGRPPRSWRIPPEDELSRMKYEDLQAFAKVSEAAADNRTKRLTIFADVYTPRFEVRRS